MVTDCTYMHSSKQDGQIARRIICQNIRVHCLDLPSPHIQQGVSYHKTCVDIMLCELNRVNDDGVGLLALTL